LVPEEPFQRKLLPLDAMLEAPGDVGEGPAGMRQHDLQVRIFVKRPGHDQQCRHRAGVPWEAQRVVDERILGQWLANPGLGPTGLVHFGSSGWNSSG
ncbi:MAG TPA: hypothetical protein VG097_03665, partial [Gemmata sp.]|nr:hypothetical protein [Gemmata sp.]